MFSEKQKKLFNEGYGAYREIVQFCLDNASLVHKKDDEAGKIAIVAMSDMQLLRMLFFIAEYPQRSLSESEQTYIKSIIEGQSFLKELFPGFGKFFHNMSSENYLGISDKLEKETDDIYIAMTIASMVKNEDRQSAINYVFHRLNCVFNSFIAISDNNEEIQNANAVCVISKYEKFAESIGVEIIRRDNLIKPVFAQQIDKADGQDLLNDLVGLDSIKSVVTEMLNLLKVNEMKKKVGIKPLEISKHMVFTGNPGTGKTTVARIIAQIYRENGIVTSGQLVETDRSGLVDTIVGGTAIKTKNVVENALGGILFIDEAYALSASKGGNDFGQEAISTLVKLMEDHKDDLVVIVAGYKKEMQGFIESNPGLKSRFKKHLEFDDYNPEQMHEIFMRMAKADGIVVPEDAIAKIKKIWLSSVDDHSFGNARGVRNVYETVMMRQANRLVKENNVSVEELSTIKMVDVPDVEEVFNIIKAKKPIGFLQ